MRRDPAKTTIRQIMRQPGWIWVSCTTPGCRHHRPVAVAQFAILWGLDASSDLIRDRLTCARCGRRGVTLTVVAPLYSSEVGMVYEPMPESKGVTPCRTGRLPWRFGP